MTALAGAEAFKAAKQLLKQKRLLGAWRDRQHRICAVFKAGDLPEVHCAVQTGDEPLCECSCHEGGNLCAHAVAVIMYASRFQLKLQWEEENPNYYRGLRCQTLEQLAGRGQRQSAELHLNVVCASPHAPSKWENMLLSVRLKTRSKEYIGNQNNLQQLYFEKSLNVVLKFDDFSLHEQQIIRFLALHGEAENSNITLSAENTAEFFHVLPGFTRFFRQGRRITVHPDRAEAVLVREGGKVAPGLKYKAAVLPFAGARVIAGRAGCWVGRDDEYFFTGGNCETGFLRSFFRSPVQEKGAFSDFPLPVLNAGNMELEELTPELMLDAAWQADGTLLFAFDYLYRAADGVAVLAPGSGSLGSGNGRFWKRNREFEYSVEAELTLFCGEEPLEPGRFAIASTAQAALLLDRVVPELLAIYKNAHLSASLAGMLNGVSGLPQLEFSCKLLKKAGDFFQISYTLGVAGQPVLWDEVAECALQFSSCLFSGGKLVKLSAALGVFMRAAANGMIRHVDSGCCVFDLPCCNAAYFNALAADIPGAAIAELNNFPLDAAVAVKGRGFEFHGELRSYQQEGVAFMQFLADRNFNALIADEMGLGKTVQLLALLASRLSPEMPPALIVCPASLVANWEREAGRFVPDMRTVAPVGSNRKAVIADPGSFDLLILSYTAARLANKELRKINFSFLALDEAQHIKNPGSGNARNCKDLRAMHRVVLTGTPLENSPEDLWSVMDFLQPGMLGTLPAFRRRYGAINDSPELQKDLSLRIAPFVKRRTKKEVAADLPMRSEQLIFCDFSESQRALYDAVLQEGRENLAAAASDDSRYGAELFATLLRLRQVCCHPALLPDGSGAEMPSAKIELLLELLDESIDSGHKILLFSQFTSMLKLIVPELEKRSIPFEYLDGTTRNRQQHIDNFNQNEDIPLFLLSLKAGGTGLNLTSADTVIIYDPWWNPAAELQAADRTHRIGQTRPVSISRLVMRNSIEEKILALQARKRELFFNLVENPAATTGKLSLAELNKLLY